MCAGVGVMVTIKVKDEQEVLTVIYRSVAVFFMWHLVAEKVMLSFSVNFNNKLFLTRIKSGFE